MKPAKTMSLILLTFCMAALVRRSNAQTVDDQLQVARSALEADRKATVAEAMQFTADEGRAFWPIYEQYRAEMDKSAAALLRLVKDYAQLYPNIPVDRAKSMLKELGDLEKQRVETKNSYLKKIESAVSPAKALRFAQVERRLDLVTHLALASQIPRPIEGRWTGKAGAVVTTARRSGGIVCDLCARHQGGASTSPSATDARRFGRIKTTVKVGGCTSPDSSGRQTQGHRDGKLVVFVAGPGARTPGGGELVALTPKGQTGHRDG
jgi:hypothetical protein